MLHLDIKNLKYKKQECILEPQTLLWTYFSQPIGFSFTIILKFAKILSIYSKLSSFGSLTTENISRVKPKMSEDGILKTYLSPRICLENPNKVKVIKNEPLYDSSGLGFTTTERVGGSFHSRTSCHIKVLQNYITFYPKGSRRRHRRRSVTDVWPRRSSLSRNNEALMLKIFPNRP